MSSAKRTASTVTDSIPRIRMRDLFITLGEFEREPIRSLEDLRLKICGNRQKPAGLDRYYSTAKNIAIELQHLGLVNAESFPKDRTAYESMRDHKVTITSEGRHLIGRFRESRGEAYDEMFFRMYAKHPYLQAFVRALLSGPIRVPAVTSVKEHVSTRYGSATSLIEDVKRKALDIDSLCANLSRRIQRDLNAAEIAEIQAGVRTLLEASAEAAAVEEPSVFARKFRQKLNDIVVPPLLRPYGLPFDFKSHERLWSFGKEWRLWESTVDHPEWDVRVVFRTATIQLSAAGGTVERVVFDSGVDKTRQQFLEKLFAAYQKLQHRERSTPFAVVDHLRAVFCFDNACQESVFDLLVSQHYAGSDSYELNMEVFRNSGQHHTPIRIGTRNIGLIRVLKR